MSQTNSTGKTASTFRQTPDGREITTEQTCGGVLVFAESEKPGRELIGFTHVDSWSMIRSELASRGLGVGAIHQLPEFEPAEVGL